MLGALGLFVMAACFVSETSALKAVSRLDWDYRYTRPNDVLAKHKTSTRKTVTRLDRDYSYMRPHDVLAKHKTSTRKTVTRLDRDYSYMRPHDVLAKHVEKVLNRLGKLSTNMHPRIKILYETLRKDHHYQGPHEKYGQLHHAWEILDQRTESPKYDVNKLNRIYTTEADG